MAKRLGDSIERGNVVLGTSPPALGGFSAAMGGGGAGIAKRAPEPKTGRRAAREIEPGRIDPRYPQTAIP